MLSPFDSSFEQRLNVSSSVIDLSLTRMKMAFSRLSLPDVPIILVGGTNGKGSTCAYLESIYHQAGYRVGCYTSPHLVTLRERVRYQKKLFSESDWWSLLDRFEHFFSDLSLTFFESLTLLSFLFWCEHTVDILIYEVGLGGRLDATNVLDADCAVLTSIDLDHEAYLGSDRSSIALEKAGIFRSNTPAVCGDLHPPESLFHFARAQGTPLFCLNRDFHVSFPPVDGVKQWCLDSPYGCFSALPFPSMRGRHQIRNAASALFAVQVLMSRCPLSLADIRSGLISAVAPGRFQVIPGRPTIVLDAAHNPAGALSLSDALSDMPYAPCTRAVFSCLRDKSILSIIRSLAHRIDHWFVCPVPTERSYEGQDLLQALGNCGILPSFVSLETDPQTAYRAAYRASSLEDRVLVFGSFYLLGCFFINHSFSWHPDYEEENVGE